MTTLDDRATTWLTVCRRHDLAYERGAAALVPDEVDGQPVLTQVALFRLLDERVLAVQQLDPFSDAHVIARGIVGTRRVEDADVPTVASPMHKQVFDLVTGRCLERAGKQPVAGHGPDLRTWPVRVLEGDVQVAVAGGAS
ncbi:nitrite reductase (NAD(P)H) small subunit [Cellulomonas sp. zg-ZUI222]|uniref:Nitrite reductase (NAD(P)H) small subunit n=1 Tax=Cellulomonas wangleii TaxID=2816956 RepID=A0ABX8DCQ9_9CELL|nr:MULTISPECIES: nitrite reductase (NAD(P)H) small subunit [Cellulomonas]MBO0900433.1 nitrite reductase (NAD(P)H) small subunit [Cellulomonas sp. zg-ZUI22]MBO0922737.1 nitrite reductase (NAD(P)H) small subunit [Cellulomonas wangleii]MBO0926398.1 nitrite reductase (NAD(P)H) small subunit [Cellulomonas wangleii]QVI63927.1 nitrite reductase (NAD(P)H) small subunit [Cellulomonas wangleii]